MTNCLKEKNYIGEKNFMMKGVEITGMGNYSNFGDSLNGCCDNYKNSK